MEEVTLAEFELGKGFSVKPYPNPLFTGLEKRHDLSLDYVNLQKLFTYNERGTP